jgi:hypothetical protein
MNIGTLVDIVAKRTTCNIKNIVNLMVGKSMVRTLTDHGNHCRKVTIITTLKPVKLSNTENVCNQNIRKFF